ncbi:MAG: LysM peptidoglycan-binding domain-containing protein [Pseudomonadota bacterium]
MYRSLITMGTFVAVTVALIILQPAPRSTVTQPAALETGAQATAPAAEEVQMAAIRPKPRPQPIIRAMEPAEAPEKPLVVPAGDAKPQRTGDEVLFSAFTVERPTLLTTTARDGEGRLMPTVRATLAPAPIATRAASTPLDLAPLPATVENAAVEDTPTRAVHVVRAGDSLTALSVHYFGSPEGHDDIRAANRHTLGGGDTLRVGQILRIPDLGAL